MDQDVKRRKEKEKKNARELRARAQDYKLPRSSSSAKENCEFVSKEYGRWSDS